MFAGSETRSRVSATPAAIAARFACAAAVSPPPTIVIASSVGFCAAFIVVRYLSKRYARSVAPWAIRAAASASGIARPSTPLKSTVTLFSPLVISLAAIAPPIFSKTLASALATGPRPATRMRVAAVFAGAKISTRLAASPSKRAAAIARATCPPVTPSSASAAPDNATSLATTTARVPTGLVAGTVAA